MTNDILQRSLVEDSSREDCVSDDLLLKYLEDEIAPAEAAEIQRHLNECPLCFQVVASIRRNEAVPFTKAEELEVAKLLTLSPEEQIAKILGYEKELNPRSEPAKNSENELVEEEAYEAERVYRKRPLGLLDWLLNPWPRVPAFAALVILLALGGRAGWRYVQRDYKLEQAAELLKKEHTVFYKYARLSGGYGSSGISILMGPEEEEKYSVRAEKLTTQAIQNGASSIPAKQQLAKIFLIEGKHERADSLLRELAPFADRSAGLLNDFGVYHFQKQDWAEAEKYFSAAIARDPKFLEARYNLALTKAETGAREEAVKIMQEYLALETDEEWKGAAESLVKNEWQFKE